jgi:hypothetical protein
MPGERENPECLAGRDDKPQGDIASGGSLVRQVEFMYACCGARLRGGEVSDDNGAPGIEDRLQLLRNASSVANVDVLGQGHDSQFTAIPCFLLIRHISTLLISGWSRGISPDQRPSRKVRSALSSHEGCAIPAGQTQTCFGIGQVVVMTSGLHQAYLVGYESHQKIGARCYKRGEGYWLTNNAVSPLSTADCPPPTGHPKPGPASG